MSEYSSEYLAAVRKEMARITKDLNARYARIPSGRDGREILGKAGITYLAMQMFDVEGYVNRQYLRSNHSGRVFLPKTKDEQANDLKDQWVLRSLVTPSDQETRGEFRKAKAQGFVSSGNRHFAAAKRGTGEPPRQLMLFESVVNG